jgi:hypothetical protein
VQKLFWKGGFLSMAKDSQIDKKQARTRKAKGGTPLTRENMNQNKNARKQSALRDKPGEDR